MGASFLQAELAGESWNSSGLNGSRMVRPYTRPMTGSAHADGRFGSFVSAHDETSYQVSTGVDGAVNKTEAAW